MPETLKADSIEWARRHIEQFGDSDMLPRPFEYEAMHAVWAALSPYLENIDLSTFQARPLQTFLVPKEKGGYRRALRLDPIDSVVYAAAVYEAAPLIEKARVRKSKRVACAYRIEPALDGRLFPKDTGYGLFFSRARTFAEKYPSGFIVKTDIADFYNHISAHRISNALESAGVAPTRAAAIERMLMSWAGKQSRGIPAGPSASNVLAEICLNDVDMKLQNDGYKHTRYADDFRILCKKRGDAERALHDLSDYLFTSHGLSLASHKTEIVSCEEFAKVDEDPKLVERKKKATIVRLAAEAARERREKEAIEAAQRRAEEEAAAAAERAKAAAEAPAENAPPSTQTPATPTDWRSFFGPNFFVPNISTFGPDFDMSTWVDISVDYTPDEDDDDDDDADDAEDADDADADDAGDDDDTDDDDTDDDDAIEEDGDEDVGAPPVVPPLSPVRVAPPPPAPPVEAPPPPAPPAPPVEAPPLPPPLPASGDGVPSDEETTEAALLDLFKEDLSVETIRLGRVRHLFRRARLLGTDCLHDDTLANLGGKLLPALRDALLYLKATTEGDDRKRVAKALIALTKEPRIEFLPWALDWLLDTLISSFFDCSPKRIARLAEEIGEAHHQIGRRPSALVARARKDDVWVRSNRPNALAMQPWDKRAVIWSGRVLSSGEQNAWRKLILEGDPLDAAVAAYALRQPPPPPPEWSRARAGKPPAVPPVAKLPAPQKPDGT